MQEANATQPVSLTLEEFDRLEAEGFELTDAEKRTRNRLKDERDNATQVAERRQALAELDADREETRERRERARTIYSSAAPKAQDDYLVLGKKESFVTTTGYDLSEWELDDGRLFVFRAEALLHFVPKAIALEVISKHGARRLPGRSWDKVPANLLRALVNTSSFTAHVVNRRLRGTAEKTGEVQVEEFGTGVDWVALLRVASAAVRGCDASALPLLHMWLASAEKDWLAGADQGYDAEAYSEFADLLRKRIDVLTALQTRALPAATVDAPGEVDGEDLDDDVEFDDEPEPEPESEDDSEGDESPAVKGVDAATSLKAH
ncbi:MAG TPA: hypothetical protein VIK01_14145 [Polyangiaceae bacterium]